MKNRLIIIGVITSFLIHSLILYSISTRKFKFSSPMKRESHLRLNIISLNYNKPMKSERKIEKMEKQLKETRKRKTTKKKKKVRFKKPKVRPKKTKLVKDKVIEKSEKVNQKLIKFNLIKKPQSRKIQTCKESFNRNVNRYQYQNKFDEEPTKISSSKGLEAILNDSRKKSNDAQLKEENQSYLKRVLKRIEKYKYYPYIARLNEEEGKVKVSLTIDKNGQLKEVRVLESSGYIHLDRAAIKAVKKASPFPKPPSGRETTISVIINFRLEN